MRIDTPIVLALAFACKEASPLYVVSLLEWTSHERRSPRIGASALPCESESGSTAGFSNPHSGDLTRLRKVLWHWVAQWTSTQESAERGVKGAGLSRLFAGPAQSFWGSLWGAYEPNL
jgi:hypothetical protein